MTTRVVVPMPEPAIPFYGEELVATVSSNNDWDIEGLDIGRFRNSLVDMFAEAAVIRAFDEPLERHPTLSLKYAVRVIRAMETEFPGIRLADDNVMDSVNEAMAKDDVDSELGLPVIY